MNIASSYINNKQLDNTYEFVELRQILHTRIFFKEKEHTDETLKNRILKYVLDEYQLPRHYM